MQPPDVALQHAAARKALAAQVGAYAEALWLTVDPAAIVASWATHVQDLLTVLVGAQLKAAETADAYVGKAAESVGLSSATDYAVDRAAFAGLAADGRSLGPLLYDPVITALSAMRSGRSAAEGLASGRASLSMIVRTEIADAGRNADQVAMTSRRSVTGYVRVVVGKTCSRCIILAGRWYSVNAGFDRHPRCDCIGLPSAQARAAELLQDPAKVYADMATSERSRAGWSKADQKAIAEGADLNQVTNIHRKGGLYTVGGKQATREGTTKRGLYGGYELDPATGVLRKRAATARPRLTPNQIFADAKDRDEAIRLLQENGYLLRANTGAAMPLTAAGTR